MDGASDSMQVDPLPAPTAAPALAAFMQQQPPPPANGAGPSGAAAPPPPPPAPAAPAAVPATGSGGGSGSGTARTPTPPPAPAAAAPPRAAAADARSTPPPASASAQQQQGDNAAAGGRPRASSLEQQPGPGGMSRLDYETALVMHSMLAKYKEADPFRQPVDVDALGIPDYKEVICTPMDLKTVRNKLRDGHYASLQEWRADIQLIWDNALKYNGDNHPVSNQAVKLQGQLEKRLPDAASLAREALEAEARGEARPRNKLTGGNGGGKGRSELNALGLGGRLGGSDDSDSMDDRGVSPPLPKVAVKRERESADPSAAGRVAKRRAGPAGPAGAAAAGTGGGFGGQPNQGLDLDALASLLNTPMARQLGAEEPDDLAFLALWKRLMTRKQQLAASATDSEPLRAANQQLRATLAAAQDTIRQLQERLKDEGAARQAAVVAKDHADALLQEKLKEADYWQTEVNHHKTIMETQRNLLEQQQAVLRKLAAAKQTGAAPAAPAAAGAEAAPAAEAAAAPPSDAPAADTATSGGPRGDA